MIALPLTSCEERVPPAHEDLDFSQVDISKFTETDKETDYVIIDVGSYGKIVVRLFPDVAPETVENFKKLVSKKFYDGLIFHRVIEGFMIQGGGITQEYSEKDADTIKGEFSSNGFENNLKHVRGVISMARTNVKDSASSQFFIMHQTSPHLDGEYAAFGFTVAGIEVVDEIAGVATNSNDMPKKAVIISSIRFAEMAE
ncbi:MAG: peptidylprolyl isomerase [Ruminococcaceae bacterium]|nr:peptidylprolyl isomerase [Oscillospiraceae bacterium]